MKMHSKTQTITNERNLLRVFFSMYRARSAVMLVCLVLAGFAEGIGLATLLPMLELLSQQSTLGTTESSVTILVRNLLAFVGFAPSIGAMLSLLVVATLIKAVLLLLAMLQAGYTVAQVTTDLRMRVIRSVLAAEWRYFIEHPIGSVANAIATESQRAAQAYYLACLMVAEIIQISIYAILAYFVSPWVTLIALAATPILFLIFRPLITYAKRSGQEQTDVQKRVLSWVTNALQGIKPIKAMGREDFIGPILTQDVQTLNKTLRRQTMAVQLMKTQQEPIVIIAMAVTLYALVDRGGLPFATLAMLALLFYRLIGQASGLQRFYQALVMNQSAYWSLDDLARTAEEQREQGKGTHAVKFENDIVFDRVMVRLSDQEILKGIDLALPAHGLVAIAGMSGAGKTTLIDVLCGLIPPSAGEVRVDGLSLDDADLSSWRSLIGYVPQEMTLFHETVRNNLLLGQAQLGEDAVRVALDQAGLTEFIASLPEGLETRLGERGARFSGGQRQRLAIARALIRRPRLLIMDEVTTSLDPATEQAICEALSKIAKDTLVLAISHQPAVLQAAQRVIHMERGKIVRDELKSGSQ